MPVPMKKRAAFLDLPGELRNQIYYYCFHPGYDLALATHTTQLRPKPIKSIKLCVTSTLGRTDRIFRTHCDQETAGAERHDRFGRGDKAHKRSIIQPRLMEKYFRIRGTNTNWKTSFIGLLLVNKQIYAETLPLLYTATSIITASPSRLSNFFTHIPPHAASWVRRLELTYFTYGNSNQAGLAHFRGKNIDRWTALCRQASKLLVGLKELRVWVHVTAAPLHLDLRQDWVAPLLQFRRLTVPKTSSTLPHDKSETAACDAHRPRLTQIEIALTSAYTHPFRWTHPAPEIACLELHRLFGEAIGRAMLGWSEKDAMVEWEEAWTETYADWRHLLKFRVMD